MLVLQGRLKPGEWLLINGVSSGVGVASLQLGKALGTRVIGTSGSAEKLASLKALNLDVGLCTRNADFAPSVMASSWPPQHCSFPCIIRPLLAWSPECARRRRRAPISRIAERPYRRRSGRT